MSRKSRAKRYNKLALVDLTSAVKNKETIDISNQHEMKANKITIIKRDGRTEPFSCHSGWPYLLTTQYQPGLESF